MQTVQSLWQRRWLRFLLVGGINTAAAYGFYAGLLLLGLPYALANLGALILNILFSFRTHSTFVFRLPGGRRFPRYLATWITLYGVNIVLIGLLMRLGMNAYWAGALAMLPVVLLSYILQRWFVFRDGP